MPERCHLPSLVQKLCDSYRRVPCVLRIQTVNQHVDVQQFASLSSLFLYPYQDMHRESHPTSSSTIHRQPPRALPQIARHSPGPLVHGSDSDSSAIQRDHRDFARDLEACTSQLNSLAFASRGNSGAAAGAMMSSFKSDDLGSSPIDDLSEGFHDSGDGDRFEHGSDGGRSTSSSDDSNWSIHERYRQQRLEEIMRGGMRSSSGTPNNSSMFSYGNEPSSPTSSDRDSQQLGSTTSSRLDSSTNNDSKSNRRRSSLGPASSGWQPGRLSMSIDELELCKRVDQELRTKHLRDRYSQLDKQYVIRAVQCKKTFDKAVKMCLEFSTEVMDRYALTHLTADDITEVTAKKGIWRVEPSTCVCRNDGTSIIFAIARRLLSEPHHTTQLIRAVLYTMERSRAFEGRLSLFIDARKLETKPAMLKKVADVAEALRTALEGRYPARLAHIYILVDRDFGTFSHLALQGVLVKALSPKWRHRCEIIKTCEGIVSNIAALTRELYEHLGEF